MTLIVEHEGAAPPRLIPGRTPHPDGVYVAASLHALAYARALAKGIREHGGLVTSRWHVTPDVRNMRPMDSYLMDTADLALSARIVIITGPDKFASSTGGRHVELGIALASKMSISLIGPRESCFSYAPGIRQYETAMDYLHAQRFGIGAGGVNAK